MTDFASLQQKLVYNVFIWVPCSYIVILSQSSFLKKKNHQIKERPRSYITLHKVSSNFSRHIYRQNERYISISYPKLTKADSLMSY